MRLAITLHRCGSEPEGPRIDHFYDEWLTQLDLELKVEIGALEDWVRMWVGSSLVEHFGTLYVDTVEVDTIEERGSVLRCKTRGILEARFSEAR